MKKIPTISIDNAIMEFQKDTISGLKGEKQLHYEKYKTFLNQYDLLYYYGEYKDYYNVLEPYDIKYAIEKHQNQK